MNETSPVIELKGIRFAYPGAGPVLDALDLSLHPGDRFGLVAPNGSGKTTLFHIIMGLLKPDAGTVSLFGQAVSTEKEFARVRSRIGLLFQDADDQLFSPTVLEDVAFGPLNMGKTAEEAVEISRRTLAFLGLEGFEERITAKLSGGEKRLVSLATVLSMEPQVLLLDEPTTGLDTRTKETLKAVLNRLNITSILISHEFDFLTATTDKIYTMEQGRILLDEEQYIHVHEHAHPHGKHIHRHV